MKSFYNFTFVFIYNEYVFTIKKFENKCLAQE